MPGFVVYDADGRILQTGRIPSTWDWNAWATHQLAGSGNAVAPVVNPENLSPETHYVSSGEPQLRPQLASSWSKLTVIANGTDEAVLSGLPGNAEVRIDGGAWTAVLNGTLVFASDMPSSYRVEFRAWPYRDETWTLQAIAP
jgi:hypothetical protein